MHSQAAVETGQMSSVQTGQMSPVETGQISALETFTTKDNQRHLPNDDLKTWMWP